MHSALIPGLGDAGAQVQELSAGQRVVQGRSQGTSLLLLFGGSHVALHQVRLFVCLWSKCARQLQTVREFKCMCLCVSCPSARGNYGTVRESKCVCLCVSCPSARGNCG
eukprot:scaffold14263_cov22-Tisochrysis_lutea.AAC.3